MEYIHNVELRPKIGQSFLGYLNLECSSECSLKPVLVLYILHLHIELLKSKNAVNSEGQICNKDISDKNRVARDSGSFYRCIYMAIEWKEKKA